MIALPTGKGGPFEAFPVGESEVPDYDEQRPALHTSRGQQPLFTIRRDWAPVLARLRSMPAGEPPLTETARRLVEDFTHDRPGQRPDYRKNTRTLTILLYWLGADTAVFERDVYDLARIDVNLAAKPVCQFLRVRGLLVEDPELHRDADLAWIESTLTALPEPVASQVGIWVKAMREQGHREGEPRGCDGIRRYLTALHPTLTAWTTTGVTSLREITTTHIEDAVDGPTRYARRGLATALRSLFRALKRERVIFRNPARNLPVGDIKGIPRSIPSDRLMGLLDQARTPRGRLVIALTAIHALPGHEIRTLNAAGLDLSRGTLEIRRGLLRHTLYLEELTHQLAADWTTYRHRRWPASTNPHLLVSQKTAADPDHPAVSIGTLRAALPQGLTLDGLRQDRILNEAFESADPLKLMRLFGITEQTAMRYVGAAHPERTVKLPKRSPRPPRRSHPRGEVPRRRPRRPLRQPPSSPASSTPPPAKAVPLQASAGPARSFDRPRRGIGAGPDRGGARGGAALGPADRRGAGRLCAGASRQSPVIRFARTSWPPRWGWSPLGHGRAGAAADRRVLDLAGDRPQTWALDMTGGEPNLLIALLAAHGQRNGRWSADGTVFRRGGAPRGSGFFRCDGQTDSNAALTVRKPTPYSQGPVRHPCPASPPPAAARDSSSPSSRATSSPPTYGPA
ncbi:hypothetical protein ACIBM1_39465 [Streptomyces sp. NPDC050481]|uniref:hypothetical protein n=1 Tax=Streptomyces sp. NPDC050481 TaxID=3365616 RepID=UPI0037A8931B